MFVRFGTSLNEVIINTEKIVCCTKSDNVDDPSNPRFTSHSCIELLLDNGGEMSRLSI